MHHLSLPFLSLLGLSLHVHAQAQNGDGLINALQGAGLTSCASALQRANRSEVGQRLMTMLADDSESRTFFAPENAAFDAPAAAAISDNPDEIATILSYHVMPGNFVNTSGGSTSFVSAVFPLVTAGRTLLANNLVNLEGGKAQVLVWSRNDSNSPVFFLNQSPRVVVRNTSTVNKLLISTISGVLLPPRGLSQVLDVNNLGSMGNILGSVEASFYSNGTDETFLDALQSENTKGFTLFAPLDSALRTAGNQLNSLRSNRTALEALLGNHYINGTSNYSPMIAQSSASFTSKSGQPLAISTNSSGTFVASGNSTAKVVRSDVLVRNGVVHIIDSVLLNTADDDAKGDAAFKSATSAAAQSATQTGPLGPTATGSSGNGSSGGGSGGKSSSAGSNFSLGMLGGCVVGVVGWIAFSIMG